MARFRVKVTTYDGGKAVDYAGQYWSKVCGGDFGDGRVLTSNGVNPTCSTERFPDGTEFFHETGWSRTYGGISPSDFVVVPANGSTWQQALEMFSLGPQIHDRKSTFKGQPARKFLMPIKFRESLVKSIDNVELELNSDIYTLHPIKVPLHDKDHPDPNTIGHYFRYETPDDSPRNRKTGLMLCLEFQPPNRIVTWEATPIELLPDAKLKVTYTYCSDGRRVSWAPIDDCAHFLSCCLHSGGLNVWPNEDARAIGGKKRPCAYGQHSVKGLFKMFKWLEDKDHGHQAIFVADHKPWKDGSQTDDEAANEWKALFRDKMKPGDVIIYGWQGNQYAHSALYVGTQTTRLDPEEYPRIACHTYGRFPGDECTWDAARWNIGTRDPGRNYTLVHIASNSAA